ncbi:MAG: hypothetical protein QM698_02310 [Micropepsaceae bacterium]
MRPAIAAIVLLAGQALAGGPDDWPSHDTDLGRVLTAPDGAGAYVLVSRVQAYAAPLEEWFAPRVEAMAGEGVTMTLSALERLPGDVLQQHVALHGDSVPDTDVVVTAYATPAGNQMLVSIGKSPSIAAYIAAHADKQDVWTDGGWGAATPLPPMSTAGLECRMEQQPSVVWVVDRMCEIDCALEPGTAMVLIDAEVCRESR